MKEHQEGEARMSLEEYFGKECVRSIKDLYALALNSNSGERAEMISFLNEEADKQEKDIVQITLLKLGEHIEKM